MSIRIQIAQAIFAFIIFIGCLFLGDFSPITTELELPSFNNISFLISRNSCLIASIFFLCYSAMQISLKKHFHYLSEYSAMLLILLAIFSNDLFSFFVLVELAFLFLSYGRNTPNIIRGMNAISCGVMVSFLIFCIFFVFRMNGSSLLTSSLLNIPTLKTSLMIIPLLYIWQKTSVFPFNIVNHLYTDKIDSRAIGLLEIVLVTTFYLWLSKFLVVIINPDILNNVLLWILCGILIYHIVVFVGRTDFNNILISYSTILVVLMSIGFCLQRLIDTNIHFITLAYFASLIGLTIVGINAKSFEEINKTSSVLFIKNNSISVICKNIACISCIALFAIPGSLIFLLLFSVIFNAFVFDFTIGIILGIFLVITLLIILSIFYRFLMAKSHAEKRYEYIYFVLAIILIVLYFVLGFFPQLVN